MKQLVNHVCICVPALSGKFHINGRVEEYITALEILISSIESSDTTSIHIKAVLYQLTNALVYPFWISIFHVI